MFQGLMGILSILIPLVSDLVMEYVLLWLVVIVDSVLVVIVVGWSMPGIVLIFGCIADVFLVQQFDSVLLPCSDRWQTTIIGSLVQIDEMYLDLLWLVVLRF